MTRAFVFPGQGSQAVGMGRAMADASAEARSVFATVDEALGERLSDLIFEGDAETLTLTENAQPALMAVSMAALAVVREKSGRGLADLAAFVAGHSLGEYSALAAAGALDVADAARLLRLRGRAMQRAVPVGAGGDGGAAGPRPRHGRRGRRRGGGRTRSAPPPTTMRRGRWSSAATGRRSSGRYRSPPPRAPSAACSCRSARRSTAR